MYHLCELCTRVYWFAYSSNFVHLRTTVYSYAPKILTLYQTHRVIELNAKITDELSVLYWFCETIRQEVIIAGFRTVALFAGLIIYLIIFLELEFFLIHFLERNLKLRCTSLRTHNIIYVTYYLLFRGQLMKFGNLESYSYKTLEHL